MSGLCPVPPFDVRILGPRQRSSADFVSKADIDARAVMSGLIFYTHIDRSWTSSFSPYETAVFKIDKVPAC